MSLETRNVGQALHGKEFTRAEEKRAEITEDNREIDDHEKDGVVGFISSKLNLLTSSSVAQQFVINTDREKQIAKKLKKNKQKSGKTLFQSFNRYFPNADLSSLENVVANAKDYAHRLVNQSGKFGDVILAFFTNGRQIDHVA